MSDIAQRLRASLRLDAYNGDSMERAVCGRQMLEAANELDARAREIERLREELDNERARGALAAGEFRLRNAVQPEAPRCTCSPNWDECRSAAPCKLGQRLRAALAGTE